jgi:site-specific DNA-methyltransferase (adenine-specific)
MTIIEQLIKRQETLSLLYSPANTEVYTPIKLVKEMLDKLPGEVWSNPELKFCDPAVKSGIFLSEMMIRLMKGLENFERNENKRYIYIVENMIYGYTTSDLSFKVAKKLLLLENSKIIHNIFNRSFLEEKII